MKKRLKKDLERTWKGLKKDLEEGLERLGKILCQINKLPINKINQHELID